MPHRLALAAAVLTLSAAPLAAQQAAPPRLTSAFPPGARAGTDAEITFTGDNIAGAEGVFFSDRRVTAEAIGEATVLKDSDRPREGRRRGMNAQANPTAAVRFRVRVPAAVPPGTLDVRVVTAGGVSNARAFVVGDHAEAVEREPNDDVAQAQKIDLDSTVSGVINTGTDVDYFTFTGKAGQRVVVSCLTTSIDSRLQAELRLFDAAGKQLAFNRNYRGGDAVLDATLPADGDYLVRVSQFAYTAGGPDHFYRLGVSTGPWIDAVVPPCAEPGKPATLTVYGRNLPGGKPAPDAALDGRSLERVTLTVTPPADPTRLDQSALVPPTAGGTDGFAVTLKNASGVSNPFLVGFASGPVTLDAGGNDTPETAQPLRVPGEAAGRIEARSDRDWYRFEAKKGDTYTVEAFGDRIGSDLDLYLTVLKPDGKPMYEGDDNPEVLGPVQFYSRTEDPARLRFVAPADGEYRVMVSSREASVQYGPRDLYRLRVAAERPDFRLVVMPATPNQPDAPVVGRGGVQALAVYAFRRDGFNGPIALTLNNLPKGVTCPPQTLPGGQKLTYLVLSAAADAPAWTGPLTLTGKASVDGRELVREARAAGVSWPMPAGQGNNAAPAISRLERDLVLAVRDEPPFKLTPESARVVTALGSKVTVTLKIDRLKADFKEPLQVGLLNAPPGVVLTGTQNNQPTISVTPDKKTVALTLDVRPQAAGGAYTLVFRGQAGQPQRNNRPSPGGVALPASPVTLVILPKEVVNLRPEPGEASAKAGGEVPVRVRVERLAGYDGPLKLELVRQDGTKGASAEPVTLIGDATEATLLVKVEPGVKVGERLRLAVRATATVEGAKQPLVKEEKLRINVVK
jgi:hypothetical protein